MIKYLLSLSIFLFLCLTATVFPSSDFGTVIVAYKTDHEGTRLDRIRFWLINDKQERILFPKKEEFAAHSHLGPERTVVIGHLPSGNYTIQFIIPNSDNYFVPVPPRSFRLNPGEVIQIEQEIKTHKSLFKPVIQKHDLALLETTNALPSFIPAIILQRGPYPWQSLFPNPLATPATLSMHMNIPAEWKLMRHGFIIYVGQGNLDEFLIPPGRNYYIISENISGFSSVQTPRGLFDVSPGDNVKAQIFYQRDTGFIHIASIVPFSVPITLTITSLDPIQKPITQEIRPDRGRISWQSGPLFTGEYMITFRMPEPYSTTFTQSIIIAKGQHVLISPQFILKGAIDILTDTPEAIFTLKTDDGRFVGEGSGLKFRFDDLEPGIYIVNFSSKNPQNLQAPPNQKVVVTNNKTEKIEVNYRKEGRLIISSNVDNFTAVIQPLNPNQQQFREKVTNRSETLYLIEGKYRITYEPLKLGGATLGPVEVNIKPLSTQNIYLPYDLSASPRPQQQIEKKQNQSGILVLSNISEASFKMLNLDKPGQKKVHYKGKSVFIPLENGGEYLLQFDPAPNYLPPEPLLVKHEEGKRTELPAIYQQSDTFVIVPAGEAIVGGPISNQNQNARPPQKVYLPTFSIGAYEVSNEQFSNWLTTAFKQKIVFWHPTEKGHLIDENGMLICRTMEGHPLSQIMSLQTAAGLLFHPVPSKENHPVIQVSWYGAKAYCKTYGYRLPTENEWEKAAGMALSTENGQLKRYKYGFGQDYIDRTWANYKETAALSGGRVYTTPIGFYNGINTLPLMIQDRSPLLTHDAKSPAGAYDMSGNVWEWVESWDTGDIKKIVKGGCFDSLAEGVRVSERLALPPDYADIYTGFRVAKD